MSKDNKLKEQLQETEIIDKVPPKVKDGRRYTGDQKPASRKNLIKQQLKYSNKTYTVKRIKQTPYECYIGGYVLSVPAKMSISKVPARIIEHPEFKRHKAELAVIEEK